MSQVIQVGSHITFCERCGQLAGVSTRCPVNPYGEHQFVTRPAGIYICERCGALVGEGTRCPVNPYGEHKFILAK